MGPSFNIVVVFVVVFFAQMFDLSQLLVRFYNRETLLRRWNTNSTLYPLFSQCPFLETGKGRRCLFEGRGNTGGVLLSGKAVI